MGAALGISFASLAGVFIRREPANRRNEPMARIAIVGPGAIGGVIAAWLSQTGRHEVILCARRPLSALTVETPGKVIVADLTVLTDPKQATAVDWVLVATKTYDAEGAAAWFTGLVNRETSVAIL